LQIDQQTREVNGLKEELRMSNMRVKELKNLLALKEEGEEAGRKDTANLMEGFPKIAVAPTRLDVTTTLFHTSYSSEKMANSARKMFQRDSRVRKVSSIENEVNATQVE
jgi:alkylhydroperoxidase/carboxymuconolactone decarboxylase family protein YurZ